MNATRRGNRSNGVGQDQIRRGGHVRRDRQRGGRPEFPRTDRTADRRSRTTTSTVNEVRTSCTAATIGKAATRASHRPRPGRARNPEAAKARPVRAGSRTFGKRTPSPLKIDKGGVVIPARHARAVLIGRVEQSDAVFEIEAANEKGEDEEQRPRDGRTHSRRHASFPGSSSALIVRPSIWSSGLEGAADEGRHGRRVRDLVAKQTRQILGSQAEVSGGAGLDQRLFHSPLTNFDRSSHDRVQAKDQLAIRKNLGPDQIDDPRRHALLGVDRAHDGPRRVIDGNRLEAVVPSPGDLDEGCSGHAADQRERETRRPRRRCMRAGTP